MSQFQNILDQKYYNEDSVFYPENLLREARRQKDLDVCEVPRICILDPDGDILRYLKKNDLASPNPCWACYHTELYNFNYHGTEFGIIGCAVGASFAVLLAEQLFVSGCQLLISITSAGQLSQREGLQRFTIIEKAIRDEGTSYHYLPPKSYVNINPDILKPLKKSENKLIEHQIGFGTSWTTDAPYRETQDAVDNMQSLGVDCVEMEAAALYAFGEKKQVPVLCIAHLTNSMAQSEGDFEKGEEFGSIDSLNVIERIASYLI